MGCKQAHGTSVTSSPSTLTSISPVSCSLGPTFFSLSFKFPSPLTVLVQDEVELHKYCMATVQFNSSKTLSERTSPVSGKHDLRRATEG